MKKTLSLILSLCLLLAVLAAPALADTAWTCENCGQTGNTGAFCPNCGVARPEAPAGVSAHLDDHISYNKGISTISWTAENAGGTTFRLTLKAVNGDSGQTNWNLGTTTSTSLTTFQMMPGKSFLITLYGDEQYLDEKVYQVPEVDPFEDGQLKATSIRVGIETRYLAAGAQKPKRQGLSASKILEAVQNSSGYYGFKYQMRMPTLAKQRYFYVQVFMEAPNGYLDIIKWEDVTFDRVSGGYQTLWWELLGSDFFSNLYDATGEIPSGAYTVTMFWDGDFVNSQQINVGR